jgi:hypothetical protein
MLVKDDIPKPAVNLGAGKNSPIDQEAIIEQIWTDLAGTASRSDIKRMLIEVAPKYSDARILTYIPIFLRRDVRRRLQGSI